jgi:hypothetical protein
MIPNPPQQYAVARTGQGWTWHYTADGKVTLCGRQVSMIQYNASRADCRNCETKAGLRRSNRR